MGVNTALLPAKVTYGFVYSSLAAYWPFIPLFAKDVLGFTASEIGLLRMLQPLVAVVAQPLWGALADVKNYHRSIMLVNLMFGALLRASFASASLFDSGKPFTSPRFLVSVAAVVCSEAVASGVTPMVDAGVLALLKRTATSSYGRQRMFGAMGFGLTTVVVGAIVDATNLYSMFVFHVAMALVALCVARTLPMEPPPLKGSWSAAVRSLYRSNHVIAFVVLSVLLGMLAGVIGTYVFLFLDEDLGASKMLIGLSLTATCVAEFPVFHISGALIEKMGCLGVVALAFVCFFIRTLCYSVLTDPWFVLPIELLHGITFGAAWAAVTTFGNRVAPQGLQATTQAILSASKMGLGRALGGLLGGLVYGKYGPRVLFRASAVVAAVGFALTCGLIVWQRAFGDDLPVYAVAGDGGDKDGEDGIAMGAIVVAEEDSDDPEAGKLPVAPPAGGSDVSSEDDEGDTERLL